MKSINQYITEKIITEKLKLKNVRKDFYDKNEYIEYYTVCNTLVRVAHIKDKNVSDETIINVFNNFLDNFKEHIMKGKLVNNVEFKDFVINYINHHDNCPEMLDETTEEIVGYFKDFPENEFEKYLK